MCQCMITVVLNKGVLFMFKISEETKQKIIETIFVIEYYDDDDYDRYKEVNIKSESRNIFQKLKLIFER